MSRSPSLRCCLRSTQRVGVRFYDCRGEIKEVEGDYASAIAFMSRPSRLANATTIKEMLAAGLVSRGYLMGVQGSYAAGLSDLRHAEALFEEVGLALHALTTLNSIAILYNRMGDYEQARSIYDKALKKQRDLNLHREETVTL